MQNYPIRITKNSMTQLKLILKEEKRKFYTNWHWYLLAAIIFVVIPYVSDRIQAAKLEAEKLAIIAAPDAAYLDFIEYVPEDLCVDDVEQSFLLKRIVSGTETGWNAVNNDEIGVQARGNVWGKYNGSYTTTPFYEVIPGSDSQPPSMIVFTRLLQQRFTPGTYRWETQITLAIPTSNGDTVFKELERVISDEFVVTEECSSGEVITTETLDGLISDIN